MYEDYIFRLICMLPYHSVNK